MKKKQKKKAVVLLSGGMDSATCLAVATNQKYDCHAISFDYGQRHACELESARKIAEFFKVTQHLIVSFDMRKWGGSALTSENIKVPEKFSKKVPVTYVPARNTIFLAFATSWAETIEARDIFIGVNSIDYSGYPDCRPKFIKEFEKVANLGTKAVDEDWKFKIHAPLQFLDKTEIILLGMSLKVDFSLTSSCYNPNPEGIACGKCNSCKLRLKAFKKAGLKDPIPYQ